MSIARTPDTTINVWQYSRWVYLIGRSVKYRPFTTDERAAIVTFINAELVYRPGVIPGVNIKRGNAFDFTELLTYQNDYTLGKMLQKIGRNLKVQFPVVGEKDLCDALFASTDKRRYQAYNNYVTDEDSSSSSESSEEPVESSSSSN